MTFAQTEAATARTGAAARDAGTPAEVTVAD
jgi:hypothetical protein